MPNLIKPELLSPAGNYEKMTFAFRYGADAVYLAGEQFGMRAAADNFTFEELKKASDYAHNLQKKIYVTLNTMPRNNELMLLPAFLEKLSDCNVDAVIVADFGVFDMCQKYLPKVPIHVSTQGAIVNYLSCKRWHDLGATRVVLARELSLEEIVDIRAKTPASLEIETFVHGAMCVSFSGRCLLSQYYVGRDGNRGNCAQPCRWIYNFAEEKRPDQVLTGEVQPEGTYIFGSKDMCMVEHIPELVKAGICSFKIEGRMKSAYYTAITSNAYRMALDSYFADPDNYKFDPRISEELNSVSHREYCTGYYFDNPMDNPNLATVPGYIGEKSFLATVVSKDEKSGKYLCYQRNKFIKGEPVQLVSPGKTGVAFTAEKIYGENGEEIESTPHPGMLFYLDIPIEAHEGDIIRKG